MSDSMHLRGVSGWLLLLVLGLCVLGPFVGAGQQMREFKSVEELTPSLLQATNWAHYKLSIWLAYICSSGLGFIAGYQLWKVHRPESVSFAIKILWARALVLAVGQYIATLAAFGQESAVTLLPEISRGSILSCAVAMIWTLYLLRSHRVKNTYGATHFVIGP